jgi:subtilase family serine protease
MLPICVGLFSFGLARPVGSQLPLTAQSGNDDGNHRKARLPIRVVARPGSPPPSSLSPDQLRKAYGFVNVTNQGEGQTIAIVGAFDHPNIESDLAVFNTHFALPPCTTGNGCFENVYAS